MQCPDYRLRLFLSVDLVGSTAFKARFGHPNTDADIASPNPAWVDQIRHFYRDFPERVLRAYEKLDKPQSIEKTDGAPRIWKTIGDEIVFCCRLKSREHLAMCIKSFINALEQYGKYLDTKDRVLDVKGYGWVAAFPSPNVTVPLFAVHEEADDKSSLDLEFPDESIETQADQTPAKFDFLGKEIDSGFRSGKHCSADRLSMSLELAWLITSLNDQGHAKGFEYAYQGREALKGVLNDRPYPIVSIDVERNQMRRNVRQRERVINGDGKTPDALHIHDFLESFVIDEAVEKPFLKHYEADEILEAHSERYIRYRSDWESIAEEIRQRAKSESEAAGIDDPSSENIDETIKRATEELISRIKAAS